MLVGRDRGRPASLVPAHYTDAVCRAGGTPVILPVGPLDGVFELIDGLVFPGGRDFDTERLGLGPVDPHANPTPAEQQDWNIALARGALDADIPVLGICFGMQLLGVAGGGTLIQHLPDSWPGSTLHRDTERDDDDGLIDHDVAIEPDSATACALGVARATVRSAHHQALDSVGPGWRITARDPDGLIEGIERADRRFAVGVQWHPERAAPGSPDEGLFRALVDAASAHA